MGESYQVDPWLMDDASQPKKFTLAGKRTNSKACCLNCPSYISGFGPTAEIEEQEEIIYMIRTLGGEYVATEKWDNTITHVIAMLDPKKEGLPEKVMGAIANGKFVLTKVVI